MVFDVEMISVLMVVLSILLGDFMCWCYDIVDGVFWFLIDYFGMLV